MNHVENLITDSLCTGAIAGIATTLAVAAAGERDEGEPIAALNAVSHIVYGDEAAMQDSLSLKYTAAGIGLNLAAVTTWATMQHVVFGEMSKKSLAHALAGGAVVSGIAFLTDYHVVPPRLTPGFEKRVQSRSMLPIYATLAVALGVGSWLNRR